MQIPTAAILVIGDEILSGKTADQNAQLLIGELRALGVALKRILVIPDDMEEIAASVRDLSARFDYVFTSGGVGPTHDDVTLVGVAQAFDVPIVRQPELEARLRQYFGERPGGIDEAKLRMADVPQGAELIETAEMRWPVLAMRNVYILPGVPELFRQKFLALRERFRVAPFYARALYTLEDEFDIAARLSTAAAAHPLVAIGSYPSFSTPDYKVKLTLESKDEAALQAAVAALLALLDPAQLVRQEEV
ncbi:MAG: competence/damage-inducible protein A [Acidobacteria bacterium]|nr:competence/damage-inducible protein A [Acidobacteriota bacterium]MBI3425053.1 competence/damage-inducible protein A [Acidobacteriota bacterium]